MRKMIDKIRNKKQYDQIMQLIENFIQKATEGGGFHTLTPKEADELEGLSLLAEKYEDEELKILPATLSIRSIVRSHMEESGLSQKQLAALLGIAAPKISQILNGNRKPDVAFLKAIHEKLSIDGNLILEKV